MKFAEIDWLQHSAKHKSQCRPKQEKATFSVAEAAHVLSTTLSIIHRLIGRKILTTLPGIHRKRLPKTQVRRIAQGTTIANLLSGDPR